MYLYCTHLVVCFQYLSEANEVQAWMAEKKAILSSEDYGKDMNAADKLLTKHKVSTICSQNL